MSALVRDLSFALRIFTKNPASALSAVLMLALGLGANTAILSLANAVLLRPMPSMTALRYE